ncbi:alpha/beta hydrolase [Deinococcus metallilatus]|uniref:Alpha/beta hydrolase n=1 Tax=Deinococcus metallilatus TaxID=1211322 RepID=A0AAJ5JX57_9DEIO|nr:alpha/beta hydrolase [Deinococcus metallilatus]MBB5297084.1 proline iminopeptidase [Deinococcus metallilatus]QBY07776.1 alpha/beta hydrolase [Deinococcus metallilatus]RXJ13476.1 alpha/beta hydrolase [Deinococcus metallilatus]TLK22367.1 alpha/beta hydrolase [Deinococcus metallilatus]GMA17336.1 proline iminopeptidase [Deinococcus metallilatus]
MTTPDEPNSERLNGADLYFEVTGPEDAPEAPIVFLHGGPGYNSYSFRELFGERLAGRRVVYLDQRGSGRSGPLSETEQGGDKLDLDTLVADLEALREHLGAERLVPLGHGFGALVALEYARRHPERTARVIVVNPWVHFPELALTLLREASAMRGVPLDDPADAVRARTPEGQYPPVGEARVEAAFTLLNARDLLNALHFRDSASRMRLEFTDAEGQLIGGGEVQEALVNQGLWEFEYPPFLPELRRPLFVIAGVHDRSSYPEQVEWLADLGGADVTVLDAGHYPWLDDEDAFAEALEEALTR